MRMLICIILYGLCLVNEWNAIINLQNDMVKKIQNLTIKKTNSIDFGLEKVRSLKAVTLDFKQKGKGRKLENGRGSVLAP